jgi:hypothetical protein
MLILGRIPGHATPSLLSSCFAVCYFTTEGMQTTSLTLFIFGDSISSIEKGYSNIIVWNTEKNHALFRFSQFIPFTCNCAIN